MSPVEPKSATQRRRRLLVRPRYQMFFALVMVLFQIDVGLIYVAAMQQHARRVAEASPDIAHFLDADLWTSGLPTVLVLSLVMGLAVYLMGLRFSHQIVGPLPRVAATLHALAAGDYSQRVKFRPGDALQEVADDINHLADALQARASGAPFAAGAPAGAQPAVDRTQPAGDRAPAAAR